MFEFREGLSPIDASGYCPQSKLSKWEVMYLCTYSDPTRHFFDLYGGARLIVCTVGIVIY